MTPTRRPASRLPRRSAAGATTAIARGSRTSRSRPSTASPSSAPGRMPSSAMRRRYAALVDGVALTRELVTEPANIIYPETLRRARAREHQGPRPRDRRCSAATRWRKLGMGALLGVAQGSVREPQAAGPEVERRQGRRGAGRLHRQGRDLRHRRHFDQAGPEHGSDEVGHGRRRRGRGRDEGARQRARPRPMSSASAGWSRTCPTAMPSVRATSSPPCRARRSR